MRWRVSLRPPRAMKSKGEFPAGRDTDEAGFPEVFGARACASAAGSQCSAWDRAQWFCPAGDIDKDDAMRKAFVPRCGRRPDGKKAAVGIRERHCVAR